MKLVKWLQYDHYIYDKLPPNRTAQDKKDTLSKIHKDSGSSVKFDIALCPKVLVIYYWEEILTLAIHF